MAVPKTEDIAVVNVPQNELDELGLLGAPKSAPVETPAKKTPPKDPETGRFLPTAEVAPEPVKPDHPSELVEAAAYYGYSEEEIKAIPTGELTKMVLRMNRALEKQRREDATFQSLDNARVNVRPEVTQPKVDDDDLGLGETEALLYPEVTALLKKQQKRIRELEGGLKDTRDRELTRTQLTVDNMVDEAFDALGENFAKVFGKGDVTELTKGSPELTRRLAVLKMAQIDFLKVSPKQAKQVIKSVAEMLFGSQAPAEPAKKAGAYETALAGATDAPAPAKNGKPRITPEQWNGAATAVPTHREPDDLPDGDEKAVRGVAKKLNARATYAEDEEIKAGLLQ